MCWVELHAFPELSDRIMHCIPLGAPSTKAIDLKWSHDRTVTSWRYQSNRTVVEKEFLLHAATVGLPHIPTGTTNSQLALALGNSNIDPSLLFSSMKSPSTVAGLAAEVTAHPCCSFSL